MFRPFADYLDEEDPGASMLGGGAMPEDQPEQAAAPMAPPAPSVSGPTAPAGDTGGDKYTPGLAFMAAFSHNPVLQQLLQDEVQAPERRAAKAQALALQHEELGRKRNKEAREQAEFEAKKPGFEAAARSKTAYADATEQKVRFAREEADPNSELSKAVTDAAGKSLAAQAQLLGQKNPELAKMLATSAQRMTGGGVSAKMARENLSVLSKIAPGVLKAVNDEFDNAMASQANARGWAGQAETMRHNQATEGMADTKMTHMINKPQEHLSSQINDLDQALSNMNEVANLKKNVNTGVYVQGVANFVNKWIDSGLTSDSRKQLSSMLARVFNKETKTLAGAAVSAQEWARISPQIPQDTDDDELFVSKLAKAIQITAEILQKRREEYQQKGGAPIDQSVTAKKNVRASNARGELPLPDKPASKYQVGQTATNKKTGEQVMWDGSKWVPKERK